MVRESNRGQSELVGYFMIFSVVVLTIAVIGATGFVGLNNAQDYQRTTNAQHGFAALADNVDDVVRHGAPSRSTEINLADASLSLERTTEITIDDGTAENATVEIHSLVYDSGSDTTIVYSSGAVIRQDGENSVMFRQPNFVLSNDTVIVPIVDLTPAADGAVGGTTAVAVETRSAGTDVVVNDDVDTVTVEVTSPHADAWYRHLDADADCDPPDGETVTCQVNADRLFVAIERVDVRFQ